MWRAQSVLSGSALIGAFPAPITAGRRTDFVWNMTRVGVAVLLPLFRVWLFGGAGMRGQQVVEVCCACANFQRFTLCSFAWRAWRNRRTCQHVGICHALGSLV